MTTGRILIILTATLFCAASPQSLPAADVMVDISSFAPRDPNVVVRQIELNVTIKQYEKVLMEVYEARLQSELGPTESGLADEQRKQWDVRVRNKLMYLEKTTEELRERIRSYVSEANKESQAIEEAKAKERAEQQAAPSQP